MADTKISGLPDGSPAQVGDQIPINRAGINFRINAATFGTVSFSGVPSGVCLANQTAVNTLTGDFYDCIAGVWQKVGPGGNPGVLVSPVITPSPLAFDVNVNFKGPNPSTDVTRYGVRSVNPSFSPAAPGITVIINSGSPNATISAASSFQNGDGVTIFGAGSAHAMSTPGTLAVTPSLAAGPAITGPVVNGPAGATTYNYMVVARNTAQGLTAASAVVTTTTGVSSLGFSSVGITSQSRSGAVTTVTTSAPHGLAVGAYVNIFQATDGAEFSGWFIVSGSTDNTHFTYTNGIDASAPISSPTSTGGTVSWYECNRVTWAAVAGAFQYIIYSDRKNPGTFAPIGISEPGVTFWDDYGSPILDGMLFHYFAPSVPPVAATSNSLTTTIVSGGGTTSLTLAANAATSVSGVTILFDNAPTFSSAVAAGGLVYFPVGGTYVFNSFVSANANVSIGGSLYLNDTLSIQGKWTGGLVPTSNLPPSFSFGAQNIVTVGRAYPGIFSSGFNSGNLTNLQFQMIGFAGRAVLMQASINGVYESLNCALNNGDLAGICLELHNVTADVFFNTFRDNTFTAPQGQNSSVPIFALVNKAGGDGIGLTQIQNTSLSGRTIHSDVIELYFSGGRCQAGNAPVIVQTSASTMRVENFDQDTMSHSLVANLGGTLGSIYILDAGNPSSDGVSRPPLLTGGPFGSVTGSTDGQNHDFSTFGLVGSYGGIKVLNKAAVVNSGQGTSASIGYQMNTSAPTVGLSGATGPAAGTYFYAVEAVDALSNATTPSAPSAGITVNGSQGVLITFPTPAPGQVSWNICRSITVPGQMVCSQGGTPGTNGFAIPISNTTYLDNGIAPSNSPVTSNNAATAWVAKNGVGGQTLTLVSTVFSNLGTPGNGTFVYCSDCNIANPCTSGGNGAFAKRLNGAWVCN